MSHPFGELVSQHLRPKRGLNQSKLAACIGQSDSVITNMCQGKRLSGPLARERVVAIIDCFRKWTTLTSIEEANALLKAARMADLSDQQTEEAILLNLLKAQSSLGKRISPLPESTSGEIPLVTSLHELPQALQRLFGRGAELAELRAWHDSGARVIGLFGMPGVGKTTLALKLAEELTSIYPDAQFYLNLKGISSEPLSTRDVMAHVIRAYRPVIELPDNEAELAGLYRSLLYSKRVLLLMDDARDAAQVGRLIPPVGCCLIITSRQKFTLPDLVYKDLDVLPQGDAQTFLQSVTSRITEEQSETLARLCGYLPLALGLTASALTVHIDLTPDEYLRRLSEEHQRLEFIDSSLSMTHGVLGVEASFALSYELLDVEKRALWCALAVFPDTFAAQAVSAVWGLESNLARGVLSELVRYSVVEWNPTTARYSLHDLAHLFADARLVDPERSAAHKRFATYHGTFLHTAAELYEQGEQLWGLALFDVEQENIEAGLQWAAFHSEEDLEAAALCSRYVQTGTHLLNLRQYPDERLRLLEFALKAARRLKWHEDEANHLSNIGIAYGMRGNAPRAIEYLEQALSLFREIGNSAGEGRTLAGIGIVYRNQGKHRDSIEYFKQHLNIARDQHDRRGESEALGNLGVAHKNLGEFNSAIDCYRQSLAICREIGDFHGEAATLSDLGAVYFEMGDTLTAIEHYEQALTIARIIGDQRIEGIVLTNLGAAYLKIGQTQRAIQCQEQALVITRESNDPLGEGITLSNLGEAYVELGDIDHALELYDEALNIAREIGDPEGEATALWNTCLTLDKQAKRAQALKYAREALPIFEHIENPRAAEVRRQITEWEQGLQE